MKFKSLIAAAALAITALGAAAPAMAYDGDLRGGPQADWRGPDGRGPDWNGPDARGDWRYHNLPITVVTYRGAYRVDSGDRLFYRLTARPYNFQPGFRYEYQRCFDRGCSVLVYRGRDPRPIDRTWAPPPPHAYGDRDGWRDGWRDGGYGGRGFDR